MTFLTKPKECTSKVQKAQVTGGELVKAGKDAPIILEFVDETLDQVSLLVQMAIIVIVLRLISAWRDDRLRTLGSHMLAKGIVIVGFVTDQMVKGEACDQGFRLRPIMPLTRRQEKP